MLSEKIHHVGSFMFGEGLLEFLLIVDLAFGGLGFLFGLACSFIFLWTEGGNFWVVYCVAAL